MNLKSIIFLLLSIVSPYYLNAQDYEFDDQSGNLEIKTREFTKISVIMYKDYEYKVSFMADEYVGKVHFKIREDNAGKKVLFDNSTASYSQEKKIKLENTTKLLIEVRIPEGLNKSEDAVNKGWVALLIEHRRK